MANTCGLLCWRWLHKHCMFVYLSISSRLLSAAGDKPLPKPIKVQFLYTRRQWWAFKDTGRFENAYEFANLRTLRFTILYKSRISQCMGKNFCIEFQRVSLKFHIKHLTHILNDMYLVAMWTFKNSQIYQLVSVFERTHPRPPDPII